MVKRDFEEWISNFKESIADYKYYVDFDKIIENAAEYKVELNAMNSLIGSKNIRTDFIKLATNYPSILKCIPILVAVRNREIKATDETGFYEYNFDAPNYEIDRYADFMEKIGLFDMISNHIINNLYDYVLGVETGLDSNARKNRGGHLMEDLVERYIIKSGHKYYKEMYNEEIEKKFGLDLSNLSNDGQTKKRFDFVIQGKNCIYGVEVNFYASCGSKLYETARSYKMLALESKKIEGFKFIWITDGMGWFVPKNILKEISEVIDLIYSIHDLENNVLNTLE